MEAKKEVAWAYDNIRDSNIKIPIYDIEVSLIELAKKFTNQIKSTGKLDKNNVISAVNNYFSKALTNTLELKHFLSLYPDKHKEIKNVMTSFVIKMAGKGVKEQEKLYELFVKNIKLIIVKERLEHIRNRSLFSRMFVLTKLNSGTRSSDIYNNYETRGYKYDERDFDGAYELHIGLSNDFRNKYPIFDGKQIHIENANVYTMFLKSKPSGKNFSATEIEDIIGSYIRVNKLSKKLDFNMRSVIESYDWYRGKKSRDSGFTNQYSFESLLKIYLKMPDDFRKNYISKIQLNLESGGGYSRLKIVLDSIYRNIKRNKLFNSDKFMADFKTKFKLFPPK